METEDDDDVDDDNDDEDDGIKKSVEETEENDDGYVSDQPAACVGAGETFLEKGTPVLLQLLELLE